MTHVAPRRPPCPALMTALLLTSATTAAAAPVEGQSPPAATPASSQPSSTVAAPHRVVPQELPVVRPGPRLTLRQALQRADKRNLSLNAARADIESASGRLKGAWSVLIPTAGASLNFTHNDHADTANIMGNRVEIRPQQDLAGGVRVDVPLVSPRAWLGVSAARLDLAVTRLTVENVRQTLLLSVAQAYVQALTARSLITVQETQLERTRRHLAIAQVRHRSGTGPRLDVTRARSEMIAAYEELLKAHTALESARDALALLLGMKQLPLPVDVPAPAPGAKDDAELVARAKHQREDLKLARKLVELYDRQLDISWMQFLPTLNGSWQLSYQFTDPPSLGSTDRSRWLLGLNLTVPLYSEARYADLDQKRAALAKARIQARDREQNVALEVRRAHRELRQAEALVRTAAAKAALAQETLQLAETAYEAGTGSSLAVTDARRSSRAAEIDLATKRFAARLALLELQRASGADMTRLPAGR